MDKTKWLATEPDLTGLSQELKQAREARGWSQCKLASLTGISQAQISRIENGARGSRLPEETRRKIWMALHDTN